MFVHISISSSLEMWVDDGAGILQASVLFISLWTGNAAVDVVVGGVGGVGGAGDDGDDADDKDGDGVDSLVFVIAAMVAAEGWNGVKEDGDGK